MKTLILIILITFYFEAEGQSCNEITQNYDKFLEETTYSTPAIDLGKPKLKDVKSTSIIASQKITETDTLYYLYFTGITSSLNPLAKGVIILFDGEKKINDESASYTTLQTSSVGDIYFGKLLLSDEMLDCLMHHKIKDIRLLAYYSKYNDDFSVPDELSSKLMFYVNCLINRK
jgi:hypothetical protein